jgi:hypothetical protein
LPHHPYLTLTKTHYTHPFWKLEWHFFLGESSIVVLYSNLFEKLGKSEMKIETYILIFQTQKKITKRIIVKFKVDFTKDGKSNVIVQIAPKFIIMDFFFF